MAKDYLDFIEQINVKLGIDLSLYKESQMKRRLSSLKIKRGFSNFHTYYEALNQNNDLLEEFIDRITINVSEFYRNPKRWEVLHKKVFPHLTKEKNKLTIWSAACSTGEEPYSISIMLQKYFPNIQFQILATDLDETVLNKAKQGVYQQQALKELPAELRKEFFTEKHGLYYIDPVIKRSITFKRHNLLADKYPQNVDLIVCRNVLIYFTDEAKDIIYNNFTNSLTENGILFVGSTEQIFNPNKYDLSIFDTFFYQKI